MKRGFKVRLMTWRGLSISPYMADAAYANIVEGLASAIGRAVQIDPIKPALKAPGSERLKLKYEELDSNSTCAATYWHRAPCDATASREGVPRQQRGDASYPAAPG